MWSEEVNRIVVEQARDFQREQPDLEVVQDLAGQIRLRGKVGFCVHHEGVSYRDSYQVEIEISCDYPDMVPTVKETGGRIPSGYHRFPDTDDLCLGAPVEVVRIFSQDRTLCNFVNSLLIPYLFSYTYFVQHKKSPYGELSHGIEGIIEYYKEFYR